MSKIEKTIKVFKYSEIKGRWIEQKENDIIKEKEKLQYKINSSELENIIKKKLKENN